MSCTIRYDGSKQAEHLRKVYRFKGHELVHGQSCVLPDDVAGHLVATQLPGTIEVLEGTPTPWTRATAAAKAAARREIETQRTWHNDPKRALEGITALPPAVLRAIGGKDADAAKAIEEGACDAHLGDVAVHARRSNREPLVEAALKRHAKIVAAKAA